uniref:Protein vein n=1 Tax=Photinus pyralis TaxID=7054 RepID=A0A1Y1M2J5_PHOPY
MYYLSFVKCVCFIFLVLLASFLSCSGFHIDRMATMSDINKRNSFTSTSLSSNPNVFNRLLANSNFSSTSSIHKHKKNLTSTYDSFQNPSDYSSNSGSSIRQTRHLRARYRKNNQKTSKAQASQSEPHEPTGRIDTYVFLPNDEISAMSRSQRSPDKNKNQQQNQRNKAYHCQRQDVARKAFLANTVVRAKAESMSLNRIHNYSVTFRILESYKPTHLPIDTLRLTFSSDTKDMNCDIEGHRRPHDLVKAQIQQSKEYYLFLNSHGMHNYTVVGMPVLRKKRNNNKKNRDLEQIKRVTHRDFVPKPVKKPKIKANRTNDLKVGKKLRLICNVKGFPVPYVSWLKDKHHPNKRARITYKKKRTTLIINSVQMEDEGTYRCTAHGVNGTSAYEEVSVRISNSELDNGEECKKYKDTFCLNGGTCVQILHKEIGCQCPDGFIGERCEAKEVSNHSSMYGQNTFSCKLGLSTTYYC